MRQLDLHMAVAISGTQTKLVCVGWFNWCPGASERDLEDLSISGKGETRGLIDYLWFYVSLKNISLIWRRHHCRWRAAKFRPMLGAQDLWAERDLYRATPAVTWDLFSGLIWRTAPFSRLLRHTRGCGGSILTRILMGWD
jgi:hypothetical protein